MLTTDLFGAFVNCRYKAFLKASGEVGQTSGFEQFSTTLDQDYRELATRHLISLHPGYSVVYRPLSLSETWRARPRLIFDAVCSMGDRSWELHAIQCLDFSAAGQRQNLLPVRFSRSIKLSYLDKLLGACDGIILSEAHNVSLSHVKLIHGPAFTSTDLSLANLKGPTRIASDARRLLGDYAALDPGTAAPPQLILNRHCDICEFRSRCRQEAEKSDAVSLLRGLTAKEIEMLNERGVFTVTQLAYTFRAKTVARRARQPKRHSQSLQAAAIRDNTTYVRQRPVLPNSHVRFYLDVEGLPDRGVYYLIGLVIERPEGDAERQFWADSDDAEEIIWRRLLDELAACGDCTKYTIFHFGRYDHDFVNRMGDRYGFGGVDSAMLISRLFDLYSAIRTNVFLPVYSNRLKDVAGHLAATWDGPVTSGLDSIIWRTRWERDRLPTLKEDLLRYNLEDCRAVRRVADFLANLSPTDVDQQCRIRVTDGLPKRSYGGFGAARFAIPELGQLTKCAYFNYQRDKVLVRTSKTVQRTARRKRKRSRLALRINQRIECPAPDRCPRCGLTQIRANRGSRQTKLVKDLKFTATGVKRWATEYATERYMCKWCRHTCYSPSYPTKGRKFGHRIAAWVVYQQVALRQSCEALVNGVNELFGYAFDPNLVEVAQRDLARMYRPTEERLLAKMRDGNVLCADEAKIDLKCGSGYVWVFSTAEEVIYRYSPSREAAMVSETLGDFSGVLVSDFYGAYDSVKCGQQKCLIHLIRDINDDLLTTPFDPELKELAERLTAILKPIVEAIDRYGLRKRHLKKFTPRTVQYRSWLSRQRFHSNTASLYQKRIGRYGDRLFTFLSHDGVPWNNNLAENAVKLIASRRRIFGASFSENGMREYLLFLGLYQTLRRKGRSLLRFLLSNETDLFNFAGEVSTDRRHANADCQVDANSHP